MLEVGADQVADGDEVVIGAVALGPCLGGLNATVDGLGKAIAQAGAEVFEDAVAMLLQRGRQSFEGRQAAAPCPAQPGVQPYRGVRDACASAASKHLAQSLLKPPSACRLQVCPLQPVHLRDLRARPVRRVLERPPNGCP